MFDIFAIVALALFSLIGLVRGWPSVTADLLSWTLSLLIALMASSHLADIAINKLLILSEGNLLRTMLLNNYGGVIEFFIALALFAVSTLIIKGMIRGSVLYDRTHEPVTLVSSFCGFFLGLLQGIAVLVIIYAGCFALVGHKPNNFLQQSTANYYLEPITRQLIDLLTPEIKNNQRYKSILNIFQNL